MSVCSSFQASDRYVPTCFNRGAASRGGGALAAGCFAGGLGGCSCTSSSHSMTRHVCVACQLPHASHTRTSFAGKSPQGRVAEPSPLAASLLGWQVVSPPVPAKTLCSKRFLAKMCQCPFSAGATLHGDRRCRCPVELSSESHLNSRQAGTKLNRVDRHGYVNKSLHLLCGDGYVFRASTAWGNK